VTSYRDGSTVNIESGIEVVGGKGTDGLAHPVQLDAAGKVYVNVSGIVAGALLYTSDSVAVGIVGATSARTRPATSVKNAFIAAQALKTITVLGYRLQASDAVGTSTITVYFTDTSNAQVSQQWEFQAREGVVATAPPGGFEFQVGVGLGLQVNLSASVAVNVSVLYTQV
jgi:hypothetical protein